MMSSLYTAVSGMDANSTALSMIGDNIANLNTIGFKGSTITFGDVLSQSLATGSGSSQVGLGVSVTFIAMLNAGVTPVVPSKGSLGASGDLAPLAHIATVLTCDEDGGGYSGEAWQ